MPIYEFSCDACRVVYRKLQGINDAPPKQCPRCEQSLRKLISAPSLNTGNFSSPTEARYARMSPSDELKREKLLQSSYETLPFPPGVKHGPEEDH